VIPLDGSQVAEAAIGPALDLAARFGSSVALIRVVQEHAFLETVLIPDVHRLNVEYREAARSDAESYLAEVAAGMRARGVEPTTRVVATDVAARAIVAHAAGDLVVMATHARTGLRRALLGSVADAVVRGAHGPVLLLPPAPGLEHGSDRGGADGGSARTAA
jgi:nucleotide-binding universal stress UspA family protein